MISTRITYGNAVYDMARKNPNIFVVDADCISPLNYQKFADEFPGRFIEVGIAEQNMVSVAAGLASCGNTVFVGSFAVFVSMRALDQVRNQVCYNNFDVKVVGTHSGIETGYDGATHEATEDMAIFRAIPNIRILVPSTPIMSYKLTCIAGETYGPFYLRLTKQSSPELYDESEEFCIGGSKVLLEGSDITLMACGRMVHHCLEAAERIKEDGISVRVVDMYSIKPIDTIAIEKAVSDTKNIMTVEDHNIIGGLGGAVCEYVAKLGRGKVITHGINDVFGRSGSCDDLFELHSLNVDGIVNRIKNII